MLEVTFQKPESWKALWDFLNDSGIAMSWVLGSYFGGLRSLSTKDSGGKFAFGGFTDVLEEFAGGVLVEVFVWRVAEQGLPAEHLEQVGTRCRADWLVVPHGDVPFDSGVASAAVNKRLPACDRGLVCRSGPRAARGG